MTTTPVIANLTVTMATTTAALMSGDAAYWPNWVNFGVPILVIAIFIVTVVLSIKCGNKKPVTIEMLQVPVIVTKDDSIHSASSLDKRSDTSQNSDSKKTEAQDTVTDMLQKAKEQAKKSRAGKRLSSIRSRVSSSSQYDYSPLDEAATPLNNQLQDSSENESDLEAEACANHTVTVDVLHHSPPRNVLISSEDSGFTESSNSQSRTSSAEAV